MPNTLNTTPYTPYGSTTAHTILTDLLHPIYTHDHQLHYYDIFNDYDLVVLEEDDLEMYRLTMDQKVELLGHVLVRREELLGDAGEL
jgi:hypothetical protein